jgi:hypothetical protein
MDTRSSEESIDVDSELDKFIKEHCNDPMPEYDSLDGDINDNDSLITIHSQESSNERIFITDEDKILNTETFQIILDKGYEKPRFEKIF